MDLTISKVHAQTANGSGFVLPNQQTGTSSLSDVKSLVFDAGLGALIVRDESAFIEACLQSLIGVVDEIVVVDTGSTRRHGRRRRAASRSSSTAFSGARTSPPRAITQSAKRAGSGFFISTPMSGWRCPIRAVWRDMRRRQEQSRMEAALPSARGLDALC